MGTTSVGRKVRGPLELRRGVLHASKGLVRGVFEATPSCRVCADGIAAAASVEAWTGRPNPVGRGN